MVKYQVKFKSSAAKELKSLPSNIIQKIKRIIDEQLTENPRTLGVIKLQGDDKLYRIKVGEYRIIFEIDDSNKILKITRVRHRQDVYKK